MIRIFKWNNLIIINLLLIISVLFQSCNYNSTKNNKLENGFIDLSNYDFSNRNIKLNGKVHFYWEKFLNKDSTQKYSNIFDTIYLSKSWNSQPKSKKQYTVFGYATYHFKIKISDNDVGKQFIIRPEHFIPYASEIYVNNKLVSHNGSVGTSLNDNNYKPSRNTRSNTFIAKSNILDVIIWTSNYNNFRGGIIRKIDFGYASNIISQREKGLTFDLIVVISLLIMFFYHLLIYIVSLNEKTSLYFSLTCLVFALDLSLQDSMTYFLFIPNSSFWFYSSLQKVLPYIIPPSFIFFLYAIFPNSVSKIIRNIIGVVSIILVSATLFFNSEFSSLFVKPHFLYMLILVFYIYYVSIRAILNKEFGAKLFLFAYFIFSICAINDILNMFEIIQTTNIVSYGLMVFIFLLSVVQGSKLSQMYKKILNLSGNLKTLNTELEQKVIDRTYELNNSLEKLKRLNQFQEDMSNMIVHDLKEPLNHIVNIRNYVKNDIHIELIKRSGLKMLNLVENILDISKYEDSEMKLNKQEIDIVELVSNILTDIEFQIKQKNLTINFPKNTRCIINADKQVINRIILNLFSNTIKFSPNNKDINIIISKENSSGIKISISNEGPHIPKDMQKSIFERYKQGQINDGESIKSTGLGLTFCKIAVEAHKGKIGVISEIGKDVIFWFTLPELIIFEENNKSDVLNKDKKQNLEIEDKEYLEKFLIKLENLEIYEISSIYKILNRIELKNERIKIWCNNIKITAQAINYEKYKELLIEARK